HGVHTSNVVTPGDTAVSSTARLSTMSTSATDGSPTATRSMRWGQDSTSCVPASMYCRRGVSGSGVQPAVCAWAAIGTRLPAAVSAVADSRAARARVLLAKACVSEWPRAVAGDLFGAARRAAVDGHRRGLWGGILHGLRRRRQDFGQLRGLGHLGFQRR